MFETRVGILSFRPTRFKKLTVVIKLFIQAFVYELLLCSISVVSIVATDRKSVV